MMVGDTTHRVVAAAELAVGRVTACHPVTPALTVCHDLTR
eukprot:gene16775-22987_t